MPMTGFKKMYSKSFTHNSRGEGYRPTEFEKQTYGGLVILTHTVKMM